MEVLFAGWVL